MAEGVAMSLAKETERAEAILGRGLFSHLLEILWRSAFLTALLVAVDYFFRPQAFDMEDVWSTFIICLVGFTIITFFGLLLAAGKYRKPNKGGRE
jgi:hypothetical protein